MRGAAAPRDWEGGAGPVVSGEPPIEIGGSQL